MPAISQSHDSHHGDDVGFLEPNGHAFASSGVAYPGDLTSLKAIYDRVCNEQGLPVGCPEAAELAAVAMDLFARGTFDEEVLLRELRRY